MHISAILDIFRTAWIFFFYRGLSNGINMHYNVLCIWSITNVDWYIGFIKKEINKTLNIAYFYNVDVYFFLYVNYNNALLQRFIYHIVMIAQSQHSHT